jgi:uncharacterized protein YdeI (YjbR/CyaY-like superfamily)
MSREPRIDAYVAKAQPFAQPILDHVRERVHAVLPDAEEAMKWSMPAYLIGGKIVLITAAFKAHVALNFWRGQDLETSHASVGAMGQFGKIKSLEELPPDAELDRLIRDAADLSKIASAPRKTKSAPKPAPQLHPQFAAALDKAPAAKAVLDSFPPSAQRDYFEWIAEARQEGTRQKRIAAAIEWLSEGKRRHWKYQNC